MTVGPPTLPQSSRPEVSGARKVAIVAILATTALAILLVVLELVVRAYSALFFPKMMVLDDELGWRHATTVAKAFVNERGERIHVRQNALGLRGPDVADVPAPAARRVLVLGDSFTEAVHVNEDAVFTTLLAGDTGWEVLNAGVGGYGTIQEALYLETQGLALRPSIVLLMYFDNDLSDNCLAYSPGFGPRPYARRGSSGIEVVTTLDATVFRQFILPVPFAISLNRHSYLYNFVNNRIYQQLLGDRMRRRIRDGMEQALACGQLEVFAAVLDRLRADLRGLAIPLGIGLIPTKQEAETGQSANQDRILALCSERAIPCLSLLPAFHAATSRESLYFEEDIHWTKEGHALAAQTLAPFVKGIAPPARLE